jgi:hypothetical protein
VSDERSAAGRQLLVHFRNYFVQFLQPHTRLSTHETEGEP